MICGVTAAWLASVIVTEIRPRPSFWASLTPPSSLWPSLRTMTASVCGPSVRSAVGIVNVAVPVVGGEDWPLARTFWPR